MESGRNLRANFPILAAFQPRPRHPRLVNRPDPGLPTLPTPVVGQNGRITIPTNYAVNTASDDFQRSYIFNYNFTVQRDLGRGYLVQAGYVASRAVRVTGRFNANAGQVIGADRNGQPLFPKFGRAVETSIVGPMGNNNYHSLQTSMQRSFKNGFQARGSYTWSKAMGWCCNTDNNGSPFIQALAYTSLNYAPLDFDRTHT